MAKRTRQQKILNAINVLVLKGYDQGVWQSLIVHTLLLTALALINDSYQPQKPIAIEIAFTANQNDIDYLDDTCVSMLPSASELSDAIDAASAGSTELVSHDTIPVEVSSIEELDTQPTTNIKNYTSHIEVTDLLSYTDASVEDNPENNTVNDNDNDNQEITTTNIVGSLIQALQPGLSNNNTAAGGGIEQRLAGYGAKTGDVQISLAWNTIDDIDLHVKFTPGNGLVDNIDWTNRIGKLSSGMLDIDMNANAAAMSHTPIENIFWPPGSSPHGFFAVYVHFFRSWSGNTKVPVLVRIKNGNKIETFQIIAQLYSNPQIVKQFRYPTNQKTSF